MKEQEHKVVAEFYDDGNTVDRDKFKCTKPRSKTTMAQMHLTTLNSQLREPQLRATDAMRRQLAESTFAQTLDA